MEYPAAAPEILYDLSVMKEVGYSVPGSEHADRRAYTGMKVECYWNMASGSTVDSSFFLNNKTIDREHSGGSFPGMT